MKIVFIPTRTPQGTPSGLPQSEVIRRMNMGWVIAGRVSIIIEVDKNRILTPGEMANMLPQGAVVDVDVWVLPEPMIPQNVIMQNLLAAPDIDSFCVAMFGINRAGLGAALAGANQPDGNEENKIVH